MMRILSSLRGQRPKQFRKLFSRLLRLPAFAGVLAMTLFLIFLIADWCYPINLKRYHEASVVVTANDTVAHVFLTKDDKWREQVKTSEVSKLYLQTLIAREDRYFKNHLGINPFAIIRATYQRLRYGRVISGASTITMQTARLLEPRKRTLGAKLIECFRSLQLEWHLSKDEILNIYMTLAPLGSNIEGVKAGASAYFQKEPHNLTPAEVALLVALVQSPTRLNPYLYPERATRSRNKILYFMQKEKIITTAQYNHYLQAPLSKVKIKPPRAIPHLAWKLKNDFPQALKIQTAIDLTLQNKIEALLKQNARFLPPRANTAVLIADISNNQIVAYVGSNDFYDQDNHGFIDYIQAVRSPGSTLKPFIYALGIEQGYIHSNTLLLDERRRYGAYYPDNFDKQTRGVVSVKEALGLSLNIPVVTLLNEVGLIRFLGLLKEMGIEPQYASHVDAPSLAIALGGIGMNLEQLVTLYSGLAQDGELNPLSYGPTPTKEMPKRFLSSHASQEITKMLTIRLDDLSQIAVKTGTSYGHRDALVLGYGRRYVVGIWCGIHDGTSMGEIWARDLTLPLLEKINALLPHPNSIKNETTLSSFKLSPSLKHETISNLTEPLRLLFPVADSMIELVAEHGGYKPILLQVSGGTRPYRWIIDGKPMAPQWQQKQLWDVSSSGFYTITVVDGKGLAQTIHVQATE